MHGEHVIFFAGKEFLIERACEYEFLQLIRRATGFQPPLKCNVPGALNPYGKNLLSKPIRRGGICPGRILAIRGLVRVTFPWLHLFIKTNRDHLAVLKIDGIGQSFVERFQHCQFDFIRHNFTQFIGHHHLDRALVLAPQIVQMECPRRGILDGFIVTVPLVTWEWIPSRFNFEKREARGLDIAGHRLEIQLRFRSFHLYKFHPVQHQPIGAIKTFDRPFHFVLPLWNFNHPSFPPQLIGGKKKFASNQGFTIQLHPEYASPCKLASGFVMKIQITWTGQSGLNPTLFPSRKPVDC